jgi:type II restriction enzyme
MTNKLDESLQILRDLGVPRGQQNKRTALCLLALLDIKEESKWEEAKHPLIGITPIIEFARKYYQKDYAPNTRETFRRFSMHQLVEAGIALYNPDMPERAVNSPYTVYQISPAVHGIVTIFGTGDYNSAIEKFHRISDF